MIPTDDAASASVAVLRSWMRGSQRSFDIAARSLSESESIGGAWGSSLSAGSAAIGSGAAEGALHHHWSGLFQFAAIRVGAESATGLLDRLRLWADQELVELCRLGEGARPGPLLYREL